MQMPPADPDTLCAELLHDLPPETTAMARACKAFVRAKQVQPPQHLLRVGFFYCGVDQSRRATAAAVTLLSASMTDSARAERLAACRPWGQAVWATRRPPTTVATLPTPWRVLVLEGRHGPGPGAQGPPERRHSWLDWVPVPFGAMRGTAQHPGASRGHLP